DIYEAVALYFGNIQFEARHSFIKCHLKAFSCIERHVTDTERVPFTATRQVISIGIERSTSRQRRNPVEVISLCGLIAHTLSQIERLRRTRPSSELLDIIGAVTFQGDRKDWARTARSEYIDRRSACRARCPSVRKTCDA